MKAFLFFLIVLTQNAQANKDTSFAMSVREQAMSQLHNFHPEEVLPGFNSTPAESTIVIGEGEQPILNALGEQRMTSNDTASFVHRQEKQRTKAHPSSQSLDYAERLLENPDKVLETTCQKVPVPCEEKIEQKSCEEQTQYQTRLCQRLLKLSLKRDTFSITRVPKSPFTLDLTQCDSNREVLCTEGNLIRLPANCEHIEVNAHAKGQALTLSKTPTCQDATLTFNASREHSRLLVKMDVHVWRSESHWQEEVCEHASCQLATTNNCLEPNQTKIIDGIPITKPCWGLETRYRCPGEVNTTCQPFIDAGCGLAQTSCIDETCEAKALTYQCVTKTCFPDKEVCQSKMACVAGECDVSHDEVSHDSQEGIGRLGTLAGTAEDVAQKQVEPHEPSIFEGTFQECEKYPLGLRDCCTDSGFLEALIHCPKELQTLQRAKLEGRVASLGHYKHGTFGSTHYGFCVFPTRLAGIVQIEGRFEQLGISFGTAEASDCRGLTVAELSQIDFGRLHIEPLIEDFIAKKKLPDEGALQEKGETEVKRQYQEKGAS